MRKREIEKIKTGLLRERAKLLGDSESLQKLALAEKRSESAGDLSAMPIHFADMGTDTYHQEVNVSLMESENELVEEINNALDRIVAGTYGACPKCDKKISSERLKALPSAKHCIDCQLEIERLANS